MNLTFTFILLPSTLLLWHPIPVRVEWSTNSVYQMSSILYYMSILMVGFHSPLPDTASSCPALACPAWALQGSLAGASVGREGRRDSCLGLEFGSCPWAGRSCWGSWATPCWPDSCLREGLAGSWTGCCRPAMGPSEMRNTSGGRAEVFSTME